MGTICISLLGFSTNSSVCLLFIGNLISISGCGSIPWWLSSSSSSSALSAVEECVSLGEWEDVVVVENSSHRWQCSADSGEEWKCSSFWTEWWWVGLSRGLDRWIRTCCWASLGWITVGSKRSGVYFSIVLWNRSWNLKQTREGERIKNYTGDAKRESNFGSE